MNTKFTAKPAKPTALVERLVPFPAGPIKVKARLWQWQGTRLMTHQITVGIDTGMYRVSEETTGAGVPCTHAQDEGTANRLAIDVLNSRSDNLAEAIAKFPVLNP